MQAEYRCIVADPPWQERGGGRIKRGADRHYPVLPAHGIVEAMVKAPCWRPAPNSHLWLWATTNKLPVALDLVKALGFRYVTHFVWVKSYPAMRLEGRLEGSAYYRLGRPGLGQYLRGQHEMCLLGVRGRLAGQSKKVPSVVMAERGAHSAKPAQAFDAIEQVSPGPRLEMFARGPRAGWDCWGEVDGEQLMSHGSEKELTPDPC